ncbi:LAXTG-anchored chaplin ChpC [Streptomyces kunmingensis]|uniref:chaplin n=1 Tax=Streptomyces kunmingensis TaxID=68225 RepID=UPI002D76FED6|nr:chaplin family protein [Streptomyces kunmingensis]
MRQVTRKGLITVAAASGVLAVTGGYAHADSGAQGAASNSPGVASGNSVQTPVHAPVNLCGNTVNVIGLLNPAMGNKCANASDDGDRDSGYGGGGSHHSGGGSHADGSASNSPGVGSGNHVQAPVDVPANACGNSVNVVGLLNPAMGNGCANPGGEDHTTPPGGPEQPPSKPHDPGTPDNPGTPNTPGDPGTPGTPETRGGHYFGNVSEEKPNQPQAQTVSQPKAESQLAMTGSSLPIGAAIPVGAGALLAGAVLYRRARATV